MRGLLKLTKSDTARCDLLLCVGRNGILLEHHEFVRKEIDGSVRRLLILSAHACRSINGNGSNNSHNDESDGDNDDECSGGGDVVNGGNGGSGVVGSYYRSTVLPTNAINNQLIVSLR